MRIRLVFLVLAAAVAGARAQDPAAEQPQDTHGLKVRELHPRPTPTPFPLNAATGRASSLEFRAPEQMTAADRELADANQAEIARRAGLQGFDLGREGKGGKSWGYEQAVCPVFPQHLILEYSRDNGPGDVTLFSAAIPRGQGHVRVIPVRRRSYSLWTPAASNELTLNDFNRMVSEGRAGLPPDWLTLGLCYAALAGGHVRAALVPRSSAEESYPLLLPAKLSVSGKGGAEVHFVDATAHGKAMDWTLTFAQNGHLLRVRHVVSGEVREGPLPADLKPEPSIPTKQSAIDLTKPGN